VPLYDFHNDKTGEVEEHLLPYSRLHAFQDENPHLRYKPSIKLVDPTRLGTYTNKLPTDFREGILGKAKKAHPLGDIQI